MAGQARTPGAPSRASLFGKFGWTSLGAWTQALLGLASIAVLTRLLSAQDYGVFGIALIVAGLADLLTGGVMASRLEQAREITRDHPNSAFWANMALASVLAILMVTFAGPIAALFGAAAAAPVIAAFAGLVLLTALTAIPNALLRRQLRFRAIAQAEMAASSFGLLAAVAAAGLGAGVWSLFILEAGRRLVLAILVLRSCRWWPHLAYSHHHFLEMLSFNSAMFASALIGRLDRMAPQLAAVFIGGPSALGLFNVALRIGDQVQALIAAPIGAMALPVLSAAGPDRGAMHRIMGDAWRAIAIGSFPCIAGLAAISPFLIPIMVGPEFGSIAAVAALLILANLRIAASRVNIAAMQATGKAFSAAGSLLASFAAHVILIGLLIPFGIAGIAGAAFARGMLTWPLAAGLVKRATGFGIGKQFSILLPPLLASGLMGAGVFGLGSALSEHFAAIWLLPLLIAIGVLFYAILLWISDPWVRKGLGRLRKERWGETSHAQ